MIEMRSSNSCDSYTDLFGCLGPRESQHSARRPRGEPASTAMRGIPPKVITPCTLLIRFLDACRDHCSSSSERFPHPHHYSLQSLQLAQLRIRIRRPSPISTAQAIGSTHQGRQTAAESASSSPTGTGDSAIRFQNLTPGTKPRRYSLVRNAEAAAAKIKIRRQSTRLRERPMALSSRGHLWNSRAD